MIKMISKITRYQISTTLGEIRDGEGGGGEGAIQVVLYEGVSERLPAEVDCLEEVLGGSNPLTTTAPVPRHLLFSSNSLPLNISAIFRYSCLGNI